MDCATCNEMLVDLVCGELDDVRAAAVRRHAAGCGECGPALARLERGHLLTRRVTVEEPPAVSPALRAAIDLAAQRARSASATQSAPRAALVAAEFSRVDNADAPDETESDERHAETSPGVTRWLERIGAFAMRRQVAMAAVFLMTVGVGLAYYQTHPRFSELADARRPDVVPAQEVANGPSTHAAASASIASTRRITSTGAPSFAHAPAAAPVRNDELQGLRAGAGSTRVTEAHRAGAAIANGSHDNVAEAQLQHAAAAAAEASARPTPAATETALDDATGPAANVARLRSALARSHDLSERARLSRELAAELQRLGRYSEASQVLAALEAPAGPTADAPPAAAVRANAASSNVAAGSVDLDPESPSSRPLEITPRRAAPRPSRMARPRSIAPGNRATDLMDFEAAH